MNNINTPESRGGNVNIASGMNILLGIWLVVSPWIVGVRSEAMMWNNIIVGLAVLVFAAIRIAARDRVNVPNWANLVAGLWLIVAPFVFADVSAGQMWNSVIVGALVAVLALATGRAGMPSRTTR